MINFPPRNESLDFFNRLNLKYKIDGHRPAQDNVFVDNEGIGVWTQEYERYRINGLGHEKSINNVFNQINDIWHLPLIQLNQVLPDIHVENLDFVDSFGKLFKGRGVSHFLLYMKHLLGLDIRPYLEDVAELFNTVRVLGMVSWGPLNPKNFPHFYDELVPFVRLLKSYGLYCEFVIFADAQILMPDMHEQLNHSEKIKNMLKSEFLFIEEGNEYGDWRINDYSKNGFDPHNFSYWLSDAKFLYSRGSGTAEVPCIPLTCDYGTYHSSRDGNERYPKWMFDPICEMNNGFSDYPAFQHPIWDNEPKGFGTKPGRCNNEQQAFELGCYLATCAGINFHSDDTLNSNLMDDNTKRLARAFSNGCVSVLR